jgi:aspartate-semialdehyde dehydrogenase
MKAYHIAVIGATGAVGQELLGVLERRNFPVASLRPISSARSAGKSVRFRDEPVSVQQLSEDSFERIDVAFFSAGGKSRANVPDCLPGGRNRYRQLVGVRMEAHVPLVIPEINAEDATTPRAHCKPNCTTAIR